MIYMLDVRVLFISALRGEVHFERYAVKKTNQYLKGKGILTTHH